MKILHRLAMTVTALLLATGTAQAQLSVDVTGEIDSNLRIAIPSMPTPQVASTPAGSTDVLGRQIAEVIASDLRGSGLFRPMGAAGVKQITFPEVTFAAFPHWSGPNSEALVRGICCEDGGGKLEGGCVFTDT